MDPPKVPPEISDGIDWSDVARHAEDLMKNNSKLTPEALKEYWKGKSSLGTHPSNRQNDPRKYEGSSKTFDTRAKKHESEKKALLAVLADSSKRILERCEKSAQLSQKEQRPIPPEGLQLQPPAIKYGPDPPPPLPPVQEQEAVERKASSSVSDFSELTAEQSEEIGKILRMSKKLEEQATELSEKYKRQNAVEAARKMIKENEGKLAKAPMDEPSTSAAAYGPWIPPNHDTERERHPTPHRGHGGRGHYKRYGYRGPPHGSFNPY
uniref:Peroxin-14 n=1 Tax=Globodera pallida TaxID=36090 RepID=A0A183BU70_GLOPA